MSCSSGREVDIIIAGGGTSGCVIASRLAEADPSLRILILEAGPPTLDDPAHIQPARYLSHLLPGSITTRAIVGKESEHLGGRAPVILCGQCLGGGSSVNFAMYARPAASDYDDWESIHGNPGWGSKDLIPFLKMTETYQVQENCATHGYSGPLGISYGGLFTNVGKQFLEVAAQYDTARTTTDDINGMYECNAYGRWQKFIDARTGRRSDVPHNYLYNHNYQNVEILTGYLVKRVLFEGERAVGVEYLPNTRFRPDEAASGERIVRARILVVVSAGAFGSPGILERSGIGTSSLLVPLGITPLVDLPGVGENYQDHNVIFAPYLADEEAETIDGIARSDPQELDRWNSVWLESGTGLMAHNSIDSGIKLRPTEEELKEIGPDFEHQWKNFYADAPDKPALWFGSLAMYVGDPSTVPPRKYYSIGYFLEYPILSGYVHITSADDPYAAPDFDPKYLHDAGDLALMRWGYKRGREIARRMHLYRGEFLPSHPTFPEGSKAKCHDNVRPVPVSAPEIEYTAEDNEAIDNYTRKMLGTTWHSLGTCAMKARDKGGVVDSNLNVYGVTSLKVADMSIAPSNVSANTYSTALAIGEKAASIILHELGRRNSGCENPRQRCLL
ncbi:GMC oxidoreductase [Wolfiporia cocos MD-104 SS10]|uniref:GMC oxidoreductase n=1 Tax=Wolfiporia cocos (strain MD-104) TaxID=742152 RepID=A0A2H3JYZ1_WOLCO|nr:GMC oxidoreductase [Wolfiporia cocos MD-104 SS10]